MKGEREKHVLVTIRHEEIRIQRPEIQLDVSNTMRAINTAQHTCFFTRSCQALKRHTYTRHTDHGVEDSDLDFSALIFDLFDFGFEFVDQPVIFNGIRIRNLDSFRGCRFSNIRHRLFACAVDSREVEDVVAGLECQISQDDVDTCCGVGDEYDCVDGSVEELCKVSIYCASRV